MPRPKWANELHCAMGKKLKTKNTKIEFNWNSKNIFYSCYLQKNANIFRTWTGKLFKISIQHQSKKEKNYLLCERKLWKMEKYLRQQSFVCSSAVFRLVSAQRKKFAHTVHKANSVFHKKNLVGNVHKLFLNS